MTGPRGRRAWAATAAITAGLIALTGCQSEGDGPTGDDAETTAIEDATTEAEEPTTEETEPADPAYDAAAVEALLPDLSPGGAEYGENPNAIEGFKAPILACFAIVANEEDGELLNAFYGEDGIDATWLTVLAAPDNASGAEVAAAAIEQTAACEGTVPEDSPSPQETVESATTTVAGAEAAYNVNEITLDRGTIFDTYMVISLDNLVIQVVSGRSDQAESRDAVLEVSAEIVEAIRTTSP